MDSSPPGQPPAVPPSAIGSADRNRAPDGRPLARAGDRLAAHVIDDLVALFAASTPLGLLTVPIGQDTVAYDVLSVVAMVLAVLGVPYLYYVEYPLRNAGRTLGKAFIRIAIAPVEPVAPLTRGMLAKRWVSALGCVIFASCGGILDPLWLLWDRPYRQCLHDKWPRTIVVQL